MTTIILSEDFSPRIQAWLENQLDIKEHIKTAVIEYYYRRNPVDYSDHEKADKQLEELGL